MTCHCMASRRPKGTTNGLRGVARGEPRAYRFLEGLSRVGIVSIRYSLSMLKPPEVDEAYEAWKLLQEQIRSEQFEILCRFFKPYKSDCENLIGTAISHADGDATAFRMLNGIERMISLADHVEKIERSTDQIRIFFLISLCEGLFNLFSDDEIPPSERVFKFFEDFVSEDADLFKYKFQRSLSDPEGIGKKGVHLTPREVASVLYFLRSQFTHEGIGYTFHFSHDGVASNLNLIEVYKRRSGERKREIYSVKMTYKEFNDVIVRMSLRCVERYINEMPPDPEVSIEDDHILLTYNVND